MAIRTTMFRVMVVKVKTKRLRKRYHFCFLKIKKKILHVISIKQESHVTYLDDKLTVT